MITLYISAAIVLATEGLSSENFIHMQDISIEQFVTFRNGIQNFFHHKSKDLPGVEMKNQYCRVDGFSCENGVVRGITWTEHKNVYIRSIAWLPEGLRFLNFQNQVVNQVLETRMLPKNILAFRADRCHLYGSLDLQQLPRKIQEFSMESNVCEGTVYLDHLPPDIYLINIQRNPFSEINFMMENFPKSLRSVWCFTAVRRTAYIPMGTVDLDDRIRNGTTVGGLMTNYDERFFEGQQ